MAGPKPYSKITSQRTLTHRNARSVALIRYEQAGFLGVTLMQLRFVTAGLVKSFRAAFKAGESKTQCELARTMCQVIEQRRVLLRLPGPGRDNASKIGGSADSRMIDVTEPPADPVDAEILRELEERAKERAAKTPQPVDNSGVDGEPKA